MSQKQYRSGLEADVAKKLNKDYKFEPFKLDYSIPKQYIPDFVNSKKKILIEVKGYFRQHIEARKYICVRDSNPEWELVFIFADSRKPMPGAKKRKDGTKYSMGDWATDNGFRWADVGNIKELKL